MPAVLIACGGFLIGVLWMDLLFDTEILRVAPESAVATIATYYRHATTDAYPMNRLIGGVMVITLAGALAQLARGRGDRRFAALALLLALAPIGLAIVRVFPNAVRLGTRVDSLAQQGALARAICLDHLACLLLMIAFVATEIIVISRAPAAR